MYFIFRVFSFRGIFLVTDAHLQTRCFNSRRRTFSVQRESMKARETPGFTFFIFFLSSIFFPERTPSTLGGERERKMRRNRGNSYRGQNVRRPIISRNSEENGRAILSPSFLLFFFRGTTQRREREKKSSCKRPRHLARPRPACIKLDGDVHGRRRIPGMGAQRSSSRLGGPFSRSLSAVMECINIGEPAGPSTNGSMYTPRPGGASRAHPVRFSTTAACRTGIRVPWDGIFV